MLNNHTSGITEDEKQYMKEISFLKAKTIIQDNVIKEMRKANFELANANSVLVEQNIELSDKNTLL